MTWLSSLRPEVQAFKPYSPGRSIESVRERYGLQRVIKLASNENPLGVSPLVQRAVRDHADGLFRYPAAGNTKLCAALGKQHHVDPARIVVGNGSDEIIDMLLRIVVDPAKHTAAAFTPCFGIYSTQAALCGIQLQQTPLNADFSFPWQTFSASISEQTALVFITTPDNPSGFCPPVADVEAFAKSLPPHCLLVIDEAYIDFTDDEAAYSLLPRLAASPEEFPNIAIIRTFSKSRGLAGLRLGYGIFPKDIADYFYRTRLPFSVNVLAEAAGLAALNDDVFYRETLRVVREGREYIRAGLSRLGCAVYPSMANFLMFGLPEGADPTSVNQRLLEGGIIIRPLASYGLSHLLRVSVGSPEENACFMQTLEKVLI